MRSALSPFVGPAPARRVLLGSLLGLLLTGAGARADLIDEPWVEVSSPHFTILSRLSEAETRDRLADLDLFRQVVQLLTSARRVDSPVPTRILAFDRRTEWDRVGADGALGGFFLPGLRINYLATRDFQDELSRQVIQHEYVHYVVHANGRIDYPMWYDEGLAEVLSTTKRLGEGVHVGSMPAHRIDEILYVEWIPIRKVLTAEDFDSWSEAQQAKFYAESWALVHFLMFGGDYPDSFVQRLTAYLEALDGGADELDAFESAFEVTVSALDRKVRKYVAGARFPGYEIPIERFSTTPEARTRTPSPTEVALAIADWQRVMGELKAARVEYEKALGRSPDDPRVLAGLGLTLSGRGRFDEAEARLRAALHAAPDDPIVHLDMGRFLLDRAVASGDADARRADIALSRRYIGKAWQLNDRVPEPYAYYGYSYLLLADDLPKAIEMLEHAVSMAPSVIGVRLWLAEAYLAAGRDAEAEKTARTVILWSRDQRRDPEARTAREVLSILEALKSGRLKAEPAPASRAAAPR